MQTVQKRWVVAEPIPPQASAHLQFFSPILRQILYNRGYQTEEAARDYLHARPPEGCEPLNMLGMGEAIDRICWAIEHREPVAVYGDYDVDGVTATALLTEVLRSLDADVRGYIPNRFDEGYGLHNEALSHLRDEGVKLVISVDCGIRSLDEADHARRIGLDLIISDHHHPGAQIPAARAVVNPKQPGCSYPDKDLAGVGIAYKLAWGLYDRFGEKSLIQPPGTNRAQDFLDLVALGTVADLAPLVNENRSLVRQGIKRIRQPLRQGLLSLIGVAGLKPETISATDIGFMLGPRLNAAGRLDSALAALELLTTSDLMEAGRLAQQLNVQNRERQALTRRIQERAEELSLAADPEALILIAVDPEFNPGVVGLAASRLTEKYYRPSVVAHQGEDYTRASCRSIPEFHITEALDRCADLLEHHGGHAAAAGFTVRNENLPTLIDCLKAEAHEKLSGLDLRPVIRADMEVSLSDLTPELWQHLYWLQPTGYKNPQALFVARDVRVIRSRPVGKESSHLKLTVTDGQITYDAIAFRQGHLHADLPSRLDLLFAFEVNEYNGRRSLQLNVLDLKAANQT